MNRLLDLFLTFARIGGLTFGGGYAMLPILQREVVEKKNGQRKKNLWTITRSDSVLRALSR